MSAKRFCQSILAVAILAASFATTGAVSAWSGCRSTITVQSGDTLDSIAIACNTTVDAIRSANPGLGHSVYTGQVLHMPASYTPVPSNYSGQMSVSTYVVQWGDTLGDIAARNGISLNILLAVNPQIGYPNWIFPGQVINLPVQYANQTNNNYPPNYYPPSNYPPSNYPPTNYPPTYYPPTYYPTPIPSSLYSNLKVTSKRGLLVRTGPGTNFNEIQSPLVSAVKNSTWQYRKASLTTDSINFVWVEVTLSQSVNGYSTGWILVRDSLGNYFTDPNLGPKVDLTDQ